MLVDEIFTLLGGAANKNCGVTYGLSDGNAWQLLATPNLWGQNPAVNDYEPTAKNLTDAIRNLIASAKYSVDISTLVPLPDGRFLDAIREGIRISTDAGNKIVVRILEGVYYPGTPFIDPTPGIFAFLNALDPPDGVPVYVGAMQSGWASWNHSKMVIVDGKTAIAGGHNLWTQTYCGFAPVHDVSMSISGPAVAVAQNFLNLQWAVLSSRSRTASMNQWYWSRMRLDKELYPNALPRIQHAVPAATAGPAKVLALARMGAKLVPPSPNANASRTARIAAVKRAKNHIRLSQQMIGGGTPDARDDEFFDALCKHVADGKDLTIIISDKGAANAAGDSYRGYSVKETAEYIGQGVARITGKTGDALAQFLAAHVHVGPVRFRDRQPNDPAGQSWKWRNGDKVIEPANHAKVYVIDDEAFYVGSDNAYAITNNEEGLQEFGFLVSGKAETERFLNEYWHRFWRYSEQFQYTDWHGFATRRDEVNA